MPGIIASPFNGRHIFQNLVLVLCMLATMGCAKEGNSSVEDSAPNRSVHAGSALSGDVRLLTFRQATAIPNQPAPTYNLARISGRLLVKSGCLVLVADGRAFALVFKEGTASFDPARQILNVEERSFPLEARIQLGGSGGSAVASEPAVGEVARCSADAFWFVTPGSFPTG